MYGNTDPYDIHGEDYPGERFGYDGWGPVPSHLRKFYDRDDPMSDSERERFLDDPENYSSRSAFNYFRNSKS